jgi:hypothetical protein
MVSYISRINDFWKLHLEQPFEASDIMVYFYLLNISNSLGWKNPFGNADRHLAGNLKCGVNTLRRSKERLADRKLIKFDQGGFKGQTLYTLLSVSILNTDTVSILNTDNTAPYPKKEQNGYSVDAKKEKKTYNTVSNLDNNNREDKNRENKTIFLNENSDFDFPKNISESKYYSQFLEKWKELLTLENWKKKKDIQLKITLAKFSEYKVPYLISKISETTEAGYSMIKLDKTEEYNFLTGGNLKQVKQTAPETSGNYYPGAPKAVKP